MGEKKPFHRGEEVFYRSKLPSGLLTEHPARVKEMAGARDVAIVMYDRDRVVKVADVRKANAPMPDDWLSLPTKSQAPATTRTESKPLSATVGESIMAKSTKPPSHFEPAAAPTDSLEICARLRGARISRGISEELMAQMLRIKKEELLSFEAGDTGPDLDDVVLRLADVLNLPLDPLVLGLSYSRDKKAKIARETKERLDREEKARADLAAAERRSRLAADSETQRKAASSGPSVLRTAAETPRRTLEDFSERLMDVAPLPTNADRRKQWWTCARILFEIEGAN